MDTSSHFAKRTQWPLSSNRLTKQLNALHSHGHSVIDLTQSNPTILKFRYPKRRILRALASKRNLIYEPSPKGLRETREAVSQYYRRKGYPVDSKKIFLTSGTSEAYSLLLKLLVNPHEEILVPAPSYPLFDYLADLSDVRLRPYALAYQEYWAIEDEALKIPGLALAGNWMDGAGIPHCIQSGEKAAEKIADYLAGLKIPKQEV